MWHLRHTFKSKYICGAKKIKRDEAKIQFSVLIFFSYFSVEINEIFGKCREKYRTEWEAMLVA
jgi:hypothetical protein